MRRWIEHVLYRGQLRCRVLRRRWIEHVLYRGQLQICSVINLGLKDKDLTHVALASVDEESV
jgi:hypothetical protein